MRLKKRDFAFFLFGGILFLLGSLFSPFQERRVNAQFDMQEDVRCQRLEIVDENGRPWVQLSADTDTGGAIKIWGPNSWAFLTTSETGGTLGIDSEHGSGRLVLDENGPRFSVSTGELNKIKTLLSVSETGGSVSVTNGEGEVVGRFEVSPTGTGVLKMLDRQQNETDSVP